MQNFYDISLVDGYNLPVGLRYLPGQNTSDVPPNLTNIACIATAGYLSQPGGMGITANTTMATNDAYPIPLESEVTNEALESWCPWELQSDPPKKPGSGVYPYPDDNIERPVFDPCLSACEKTQSDEDCCRGHHNSPDTCQPSLYSQQAKMVCPDAYSFAYDDHKSTFTVPKGGGWEIIFCPVGRSTNILATFGDLASAVQSGAAGPIQFEDDDSTLEPEEPGSDTPASDTSHITASEVDNNALPPTLLDNASEGGDVPSPVPTIDTAPEASSMPVETDNDATYCEDSVDDVEDDTASSASQAQSMTSSDASNATSEPPPPDVSTVVTSQKDDESARQQNATSSTASQVKSTISSITIPITTINTTSQQPPVGNNLPAGDSLGTISESRAPSDCQGRGMVAATSVIVSCLGVLAAGMLF